MSFARTIACVSCHCDYCMYINSVSKLLTRSWRLPRLWAGNTIKRLSTLEQTSHKPAMLCHQHTRWQHQSIYQSINLSINQSILFYSILSNYLSNTSWSNMIQANQRCKVAQTRPSVHVHCQTASFLITSFYLINGTVWAMQCIQQRPTFNNYKAKFWIINDEVYNTWLGWPAYDDC